MAESGRRAVHLLIAVWATLPNCKSLDYCFNNEFFGRGWVAGLVSDRFAWPSLSYANESQVWPTVQSNFLQHYQHLHFVFPPWPAWFERGRCCRCRIVRVRHFRSCQMCLYFWPIVAPPPSYTHTSRILNRHKLTCVCIHPCTCPPTGALPTDPLPATPGDVSGGGHDLFKDFGKCLQKTVNTLWISIGYLQSANVAKLPDIYIKLVSFPLFFFFLFLSPSYTLHAIFYIIDD